MHTTKESRDDYESFLCQVEDIFTNLVLNVVLQDVPHGQVLMGFDAREEAKRLQEYYFGVYLESCDNFIKYDSSIDQILEDDRLDKQSFPALSQRDMKLLMAVHLNRLKMLENIHELFAYWKSLAKCNYIKLDSDLSGIFTRIKCEEKWPEVSDNMLEMALAEHLKLLRQLSNNKKATGDPTPDCKVPEVKYDFLEIKVIEEPSLQAILGSDLEEAIDAEYQARLLAFNKIHSEIRLEDYRAHERFEHLVTKRVFQSHALRVEFLPKSQKIEPMAPMLPMLKRMELKYGSKPLSMNRFLAELKDLPRARAFRSYSTGWPVVMLGVVITTGIGIGRKDGEIKAECVKWREGEDPRETQRRLQSAEERVRAAMKQVPWNMMDKHLHSDEARKYHEETCNFIRSQFVRVPKMATLKPSNRNMYIYASLKHRKTSSEDWSIVKLMQEKLQLNGKIKTYGLLLGVGAAGIAAAVAGVGRAAVGHKKYAEVVGTET
ncbi:hypothetical protein Vadar_012154 [Vaccinium darrowii]|uniref:Uncharacterized protein n=1 Tax=Vaccinium darrowii TaxID=229202 RepID=A0ACB7YUL8_9ERIC|nr:hypothetical protein Vadar_012154 [Vaccinium darrowii]